MIIYFEQVFQRDVVQQKTGIKAQLLAAKACNQGTWTEKWALHKCRSKIPSLSLAMFAYSLENWFQHYDRSQFIVISTENFLEQPQKIVTEIADTLGLPSMNSESLEETFEQIRLETSRTQTAATADAEHMSDEADMDQVKQFLSAHTEKLKGLLVQGAGAPRLLGSFHWLH